MNIAEKYKFSRVIAAILIAVVKDKVILQNMVDILVSLRDTNANTLKRCYLLEEDFLSKNFPELGRVGELIDALVSSLVKKRMLLLLPLVTGIFSRRLDMLMGIKRFDVLMRESMDKEKILSFLAEKMPDKQIIVNFIEEKYMIGGFKVYDTSEMSALDASVDGLLSKI